MKNFIKKIFLYIIGLIWDLNKKEIPHSNPFAATAFFKSNKNNDKQRQYNLLRKFVIFHTMNLFYFILFFYICSIISVSTSC